MISNKLMSQSTKNKDFSQIPTCSTDKKLKDQ